MRKFFAFLSVAALLALSVYGQSTSFPFGGAGSRSFVDPSNITNGVETSAHAAATYFPTGAISGYVQNAGTNGFDTVTRADSTYFPTSSISGYVQNAGTNNFPNFTWTSNNLLTAAASNGGTFSSITLINPQMFTQVVNYAGTTVTVNHASGTYVNLVLTNSALIANPTNMKPGTFIYNLIEDSTGTRLPTWGAAFKWLGGIAPTAATFGTNANGTNTFVFQSDGVVARGTFSTNFR